MTNDQYIIYVADRLKDIELMLGMNSLNWKEAHQRLDHNLLNEISKLDRSLHSRLEKEVAGYGNLEDMCYNVAVRQKVLYVATVVAYAILGFIAAGVYL